MDQCVAKFDHYCPWLQNDVGWRSHRMFVTMATLAVPVVVYHMFLIYECTPRDLDGTFP